MRAAGAGRFAEATYQAGLREWRRGVVRPLALIFLPWAAATAAIGLSTGGRAWGFYWGVMSGVGLCGFFWGRDMAPAHIERWHEGAEGEWKTAHALEPLRRSGWLVVNDIDTGRGNYDHVVVGSAGVFLLETKNLSGRLWTERGSLMAQPRGAQRPNRHRLVVSTRRAAAELSDRLERETGLRLWVQPIVVVWGRFDERRAELGRVPFLHGEELAAHLQAQPARLEPRAIRLAGTALANMRPEVDRLVAASASS